VRFGNVLGSAGSVVPLFRAQIDRGGPVTVTHPDMERFFMTIPEACQLIMQAGVLGQGGEIFVLDMGEAVKIRYLAEQMIRLAGHGPGEIPIQYIGLRPGEKLYEELFYGDEDLAPTAHRRIRVARHRPPESGRLDQVLDELQQQVRDFRPEALREMLHGLIPEWQGPQQGQ
jgi:FlaA1/EpsC-like NDP-sugar epimerase